MDLKQLILRRGAQAKTVLDDEVFKDAMQEVRKHYFEAWEKSKLKDSEDREKAYLAVRLLKEIEGQLVTFVSQALYEQGKTKE